jgi:penicillin amidase
MALVATLGRRLTKHSGRLGVGCRRRIDIVRDEHGVAYVNAQDELDAWFGLGFCHAQDRGGQLEITLRLARGTLSELIGIAGLDVDRASRLIGVRRAAEQQLATFDADMRDQLAAYCAGINAAFASPELPWSHEHGLLRARPTPWEPADVLAFGLLTCCFLPSNWDVELSRLLILLRDGEAAVEALDPGFRAELPLTSPPGAPAGPSTEPFVARDLLALRELLGDSAGSNAWAVLPHKTAAGRTLLANDPHLPAALPNLGYLARVKCPSFGIAGISMVGIPAFITGHNGHAAWGATAAHADNSDLFLEELSPDGERYRQGDSFVPCRAHTEMIPVRGKAAVPLRVRYTPRGSIVATRDDTAASIFAPTPLVGRANALAFAATWLAARPTRALLAFHKLRSFEDFRAACAASAGCAYSLIYADDSSVGWALATEVPRRKSGYGSLPLPGWRSEVGWEEECVPASELPSLEDPAEGFVCCANNKPVRDDPSSAFLGHDFLDGYRQKRLCAELGARSDWTVARMAELQTDVMSLAFHELKPALLALRPLEPLSRRALELLRAWDGRVSGDSIAASVYELFMAELCQRICQRKAPQSHLYAAGQGLMKLIPGTCWNARRASFVARLVVEQPGGYFDDWSEALLEALRTVMQFLLDRYGTDESAWAWGQIRPLTLRHRFGDRKSLDRIFNLGPLPGWGDNTTVNQAGLEFWKPLKHSTVTAHLRSVIEIGNFGASRFSLLGGQSGNPFSPHYSKLVDLHLKGEGVPIHWDDAELERHTQQRLRLVPTTRHRPIPAEHL